MSEHTATDMARYRMGATKTGIPLAEYVAQIEAGNRRCYWHKAWEPIQAFVRRPKRASGYDAVCIEGANERTQGYAERNPKPRKPPEQVAATRVIAAEKMAATQHGISVEEYRQHLVNGEQKCSTCKVWLPLADFPGNPKQKRARGRECKPCMRARAKARYRANPEKAREYSRTRYAEHENVRAYFAAYHRRRKQAAS